jgi:hypothetical protein
LWGDRSGYRLAKGFQRQSEEVFQTRCNPRQAKVLGCAAENGSTCNQDGREQSRETDVTSSADYYRYLEYLAGFEAAVDLWMKLERSAPLTIPRAMAARVVMYDDGQPITAGTIINAFDRCQEPLPPRLRCRSGLLVDFSKFSTYGELAVCLQCIAGNLSFKMQACLEGFEPPAGMEPH